MSMIADREEIRRVTDSMNELLYHEEMMWMQCSKIDWLREGDRNTKHFHRKAVWRARKNKVKLIIDDNGMTHTDQGNMGQLFLNHFQNLFTADASIDPMPVLNLLEEKVTGEMNEKLCAEFTEKEIADALFQIGPLKVPGPDGLLMAGV
jgi:hypothetical protein